MDAALYDTVVIIEAILLQVSYRAKATEISQLFPSRQSLALPRAATNTRIYRSFTRPVIRGQRRFPRCQRHTRVHLA
jgi:hypothetical protein